MSSESNIAGELLQPVSVPRAMAIRTMSDLDRLRPILFSASPLAGRLKGTDDLPEIMREERIEQLEQFYIRFLPLADKPMAAEQALSDQTMDMFEQQLGDILIQLNLQENVNEQGLAYDAVTAWVRSRPRLFSESFTRFKREYQAALGLADELKTDLSSIYLDDNNYADLIRRTFSPDEYIDPVFDSPILDEKYLADYIHILLRNISGFTPQERSEIQNRYGREDILKRNIELQKEYAEVMLGAVIRAEVARFWGEGAVNSLSERAREMIKKSERKLEDTRMEADRMAEQIKKALRDTGDYSKSSDST